MKEDFNASYVGLRYDLINHIEGSGLTILDVGCATGTNGNFLLDNKIASNVIGVEFNENMAKKAKLKYDSVYVGDLNSMDFIKSIVAREHTFDYIIFGDILEHLVNPSMVLKEFKELLSKKGKIIISVPNIAHIELFIQVFIKGTWPKNERGIFDKTHLSWFTKKDIEKTVNISGLKVILYERKLRGRDANPKFNFFTKILKFINKDWVTFQHIIVCKYDK